MKNVFKIFNNIKTGFLYLYGTFENCPEEIYYIGGSDVLPPPLEKEEEAACFAAAAEGDDQAREKLILHNLRLVAHIVRKYYPTAKNQDDLISIGSIGLVKAVDSFRIENGARFATYAAKCIQNEILMHFRSQKKHASEVSLNETIDIDRDGNPLTYIDVICSEEDISEEIDKGQLIIKTSDEEKSFKISIETLPAVCTIRASVGGVKVLSASVIASSFTLTIYRSASLFSSPSELVKGTPSRVPSARAEFSVLLTICSI